MRKGHASKLLQVTAWDLQESGLLKVWVREGSRSCLHTKDEPSGRGLDTGCAWARLLTCHSTCCQLRLLLSALEHCQGTLLHAPSSPALVPSHPLRPRPHTSREEDVQIVDASDRGDHLASYYADATKGSDRCVLLGWAWVCGEVRSRVSLG